MIIQINTDKTIRGDEKTTAHFQNLIEDELKRFSNQLSRIELHLSDENGKKDGLNDIHCVIEARIEGKQPIACSNNGNNTDEAVNGALTKIKSSLDTVLGQMKSNKYK